MNDNDAFRLLRPEDAVGVLCLLVGVAVALWAVPEPKVALPVAAAPACAVSVAQYDAGERWSPNPPQPTCAGGLVDLPAHILTFPIQEPQ